MTTPASPATHYIPRDQRFNDLLDKNHLLVSMRQERGELPHYALFVDRLFKEMPTVSLTDVKKLIAEIAAGDPDGKLYATALIETLGSLDSPDGSAMHAAVGCAGEGGELLDCVKKVFIYRKRWDQLDLKTDQTPLENLLEELGDFRFYYQKLLNMLRISDMDVQAANFAKLSVHYASGSYSDAQAQARADKEAAPQPSYIGHKVTGDLPPLPPVRTFLGKPPEPLGRRKDDNSGNDDAAVLDTKGA